MSRSGRRAQANLRPFTFVSLAGSQSAEKLDAASVAMNHRDVARTAPIPNIPAIPGMNPGIWVMGGGGGAGGGNGRGGRGQGNGQGGREHGQKCDQLPGARDILNKEHREYIAKVWGIDEKEMPGAGVDAYELFRKIDKYAGCYRFASIRKCRFPIMLLSLVVWKSWNSM